MFAPESAYAEAEQEQEDRRHALKRRINEVDGQIDRRVYELYGLTQDEIAIVEGKGVRKQKE